jgi:membrane fusion protein (multidrug efflux system)
MRPFDRTLRSLDADRHGRTVAALAVAAVLLALWAAWFRTSRVPVRASSVEGRVVVDRAVFPVHAPIGGQVRSGTDLTLGRVVREGDVLVELDDAEEHLRIGEEEARLAGFRREREAIERRLAALRAADQEAREAARAEREEAAVRLSELELGAELAREEHTRLDRLHELGGVSELELARARIESLKTMTAVDGYKLTLERLRFDQRKLAADREARLEELEGELDAVEARTATSRKTLERLEYALEKRRIRAPASGELADVEHVVPGSWLAEGERIAAIVSPGDLEVVASFAAEVALGHIERGQPARLRFEGFPWSRFGIVHARVDQVGSEAREGRVTVELTVDDDAPTEIPLQHGLVCSVEVDVDRVSPIELVLRAVGR